MPRGKRPISAIDRLLAACIVGENDCLLWTGRKNDDGYGSMRVGSRTDGSRRMVLTHRVAWEHKHGSVPDGLELDHTCKIRHCVNVRHLRAVTHRKNMETATFGWRRYLTHCKHGHEFTESNTYVRKNGTRACKACGRERKMEGRKP